MTTEELKPCPCGRPDPEIEAEDEYSYVRCVCGWRGPNVYAESDEDDPTERAIAAWNRRAATEAAEPVATTGTDSIVLAWNALPDALRLNPALTRLFEAVKTCRDVPAAPPAAAKQDAVGAFAIEVEKLLCAKLGREWSASGISIVSLIDQLAAAPDAAGRDALDAARLRYLLAHHLVEDEEGWATIHFETNRHFATHPEPLAEWVAFDIDAALSTTGGRTA